MSDDLRRLAEFVLEFVPDPDAGQSGASRVVPIIKSPRAAMREELARLDRQHEARQIATRIIGRSKEGVAA